MSIKDIVGKFWTLCSFNNTIKINFEKLNKNNAILNRRKPVNVPITSTELREQNAKGVQTQPKNSNSNKLLHLF